MEIHKKDWGCEKWIVNNEKYCGKILCINPGWRCSYHYHKIKDETFYVLKGTILMEVEGTSEIVSEGYTIRLNPNTRHRFTGITYAEILEVSTQHFEDDSYREEIGGYVGGING